MDSPSSPPITPSHSRAQSMEFATASPSLHGSVSRRSSSAYSPVNSRLGSSHGHSGGDNLAQELGGLGGTLADELGGWDEDDDDDDDTEEDEDEGEDDNDDHENGEGAGTREQSRDSGIDVGSSPAVQEAKKNGLLSVTVPERRGHRRVKSDYDGSEYGSESDLEASELVNASLEARLAAVESLARRGTGDVGGGESPVGRATERLKDLGGQAGIETGVTRLSTAHSAISTHLAHETRLLTQFTSALFSPFASPLSEEMIESLLPALAATIALLPSISPNPQSSTALSSLTHSTADLIDTLSTLSDTMQVNRQTSLVAGRRLRAVKDVLREWRVESEGRNDSVRWIEQGCWDQRLKERECAAVCGEVLDGFEDVCGRWRERLLDGAEAAAG